MGRRASLNSISPFFIVGDVVASTKFYETKLGFQTLFMIPEDEPFFAIVQRGRARIVLKHIAPDVPPQPNATRHQDARWDAYIDCDDPDALYEEFRNSRVRFHRHIADTEDGLRAFEVKDRDRYVLCFARPLG